MEVLEHVPHGIWTSALQLVIVHEALGSDSVGWGFHNAAYFSGQIIGAVIAGLVAVQLGRLIIINSFLTAFATVLYDNDNQSDYHHDAYSSLMNR
jgi:hypothetical protein